MQKYFIALENLFIKLHIFAIMTNMMNMYKQSYQIHFTGTGILTGKEGALDYKFHWYLNLLSTLSYSLAKNFNC